MNTKTKINNILIIIPGMKFGGMERVSFIMREILIKNGYNVELVTLFNNDSDYTPDFPYQSLNCEISDNKLGKIIVSLKRVIKLKRYKKEHPTDLAISFGQNSNFTNVFSKYNEKIFLGIRSYDWLYSYFFNYKLEKYIYKKADHVVSVSKKIQSEAEKFFSIDKEKSDFLYNPYNIDYINSRASEKITEIELNNKKRKLVSVGRLEDQKGFYHLIKAFSLLKNRDDYMLYIIGNGSKKIFFKK
ncbi:glycosyltransferase [Streptococcus uberis]|uniref:glycosyltransferase n=1 Tax=Streptococcus uberis TaxID=1349 RepID=UPI00248B40EF|nr:glycosyltransferase [Streptococcus uberis]